MDNGLLPDKNEWFEPETKEKNTNKRTRAGVILPVLVAIVFLGILLNVFVFTIRPANITIDLYYDTKNPVLQTPYDTAYILNSAGITGDLNYFFINTKEIENKISQDWHLACISVEKRFPNQLILSIRQRQKRAYMDAGGVVWCIDEEGMILEKVGAVRRDDQLILVQGMMPNSPQVGTLLVPNQLEQLKVYSTLLSELTSLGILSDYSTMDVRDPKDLYLTTKDEYTIHLGNNEETRKKLKTAVYVLAQLRSRRDAADNVADIERYTGGTLQITKPGEATYTPIN